MVAWLRWDFEATAVSVSPRARVRIACRPAPSSTQAPSPTQPPWSRPVAGAKTTPSLRNAALDQPDVDSVIVAAPDELLGPVERIDKEIGVVVRRDSAGSDLLFGDHRHAGRGSRKGREDHQLGRPIGFGDRRPVLLRLNLEAATHDRQDRFAGLARGLGEFVDQPP